MKIDDLTFGQIKEIQSIFGDGAQAAASLHPYQIGANYFIRTVTHIDVGKLISVGEQELVLVDASWVADTRRYANAIAEGTLDEVEPYPDGQHVIVGRGSIIDATKWTHALPRTQK